MKPSELYYRKPQNVSFSPVQRTSQPQPSGSINEDTENRIVTLYTSGQSVESITREVGRARHRVVHVLQVRGVFGNNPTAADRGESGNEVATVTELEGKPVIEALETEPLAAKGPEPVIAIEGAPKKRKPVRRSKSSEQVKLVTAEKPSPKPPAVEQPRRAGRWSPLVVDALCKVVAQSELDPGMSLEEVHKMASGAKR